MKKIVLTGGPCSGKSTALSNLKDTLEDLGYKVFIVKEAATELINQGIKPFGDNKIPLYDFQKCVIDYQLRQERISRIKASLYRNSIIIHDRGILDGKAYINESEWNMLLKEMNLNENSLLNRYDEVIHLVSIACDRKDLYTTTNNDARSESAEEAAFKDNNTLKCYLGHHNLKVVDNSTDFSDKINIVKNHILAYLAEPTYSNRQYKFLVKLDESDLERLYSISKVSIIEQTYLKSEDDIDYKVRKKNTLDDISYYLIKKRKKGNNEEIITSKIINRLEYAYYLSKQDPNYNTIIKTRYSFKYNKDVFNLDIFDDNYGILENETTKDISLLELPSFLKIINSDSKQMNNKEIAKIKKIVK